jgi:hypothetical protein
LALGIGVLVGAQTFAHTTTVVETIPAATTTKAGLPVACTEALRLTRDIEHDASRGQLAADDAAFDAAVANCRIPQECADAFTYAPRILSETSRPRLLALIRKFDAAAAGCR